MKQESGLNNQLKAVRTRLGLSQQEIAAAAGVTRQTIGGIEAGLYAPSAAVALKLARALGCRVEDLFWLEQEAPVIAALPALPLSTEGEARVTLAQVGGKWIAHPLHGDRAFRTEMIPADGIALGQEEGAARVRLLDDAETLSRTVLIGGCAPALSLWARSAERWHPGLRVHWLHANSTAALDRLGRGEIHAAGIHLHDPATGEDNLPFARRLFPQRAVVLINLGIWEEGWIVQAGNPKRIRHASDLAQSGVTLINREEGAGSRLLLDSALHRAGVPAEAVAGYGRIAGDHLAVAREVQAGRADTGVGVASVAAAFGLGFAPLRQVRYDLVLWKETLETPPVQQMLDTLHHRWVRSQLDALGGYDTSRTGECVASLP